MSDTQDIDDGQGVAPVFRIGHADVAVSGFDHAVDALASLLRLPCHSQTNFEVSLHLARAASRVWPIEISERDGTHFFGRVSHLLKFHPDSKALSLTFVDSSSPSAVYWLRRDIFGLLACLSGELMLHSSSVLRAGRAYLFCGESGVGKSTLCRMLSSSGCEAVSDEVNWLFWDAEGILRMVNQLFWIPDSVFWKVGMNSGEPYPVVERTHLLAQGATCALLPPLHPSESFARLMACHLEVDRGNAFLMRRAESLARLTEAFQIPVFQFNLNPAEAVATLFQVSAATIPSHI